MNTKGYGNILAELFYFITFLYFAPPTRSSVVVIWQLLHVQHLQDTPLILTGKLLREKLVGIY